MLDKKCTEFDITGDFGMVSLPDLLEEFNRIQERKTQAFQAILLVICVISLFVLIGYTYYLKY